MTTLTKDAEKIIKNWKLFIALGILLSIGGISVLVTPIKSYLTLSVFFSICVVISGLLKISFSISIRKVFNDWGYYFTNGIVELLVGIILLFQPIITMVLLPLILGFWLLVGSGFTIAAAFEIKSHLIKSWYLVLTFGILLAVLSVLIMIDPFYSIMSIVVLCSLAIIVYGISHVNFGIKLKKIKDALIEPNSHK